MEYDWWWMPGIRGRQMRILSSVHCHPPSETFNICRFCTWPPTLIRISRITSQSLFTYSHVKKFKTHHHLSLSPSNLLRRSNKYATFASQISVTYPKRSKFWSASNCIDTANFIEEGLQNSPTIEGQKSLQCWPLSAAQFSKSEFLQNRIVVRSFRFMWIFNWTQHCITWPIALPKRFTPCLLIHFRSRLKFMCCINFFLNIKVHPC